MYTPLLVAATASPTGDAPPSLGLDSRSYREREVMDSPDPPKNQDRPTLETEQVIRWITEEPTSDSRSWESHRGGDNWRHALVAEPMTHPVLRPPVPVLTVLDDGSQTKGEEIRLRGASFTIGRSEGDLVLPNDQTLSSVHAEIQRVEYRGQFHWLLKDKDTSNGTFVRINSANIFDDTVVLLGLRRFRWQVPFAKLRSDSEGATRMLDTEGEKDHLRPRLVESGKAGEGLVFEIRQPTTTIGRLGGDADLQIDDPHLAPLHATILYSPPATPVIESRKTVNGVWVNVRAIKLSEKAFFRCGEQAFFFRLS